MGMISIQQDFLPVFEPNDYFWENHWIKEGENKEQKWEAFARVTRQIMAEHGGYELSELSLDDKLVYKTELFKLHDGNMQKLKMSKLNSY